MRIALIVPGGVDRSGVDRVTPRLLWFVERLARTHDVHIFVTDQEQEAGDWMLLGARVHNVGRARGRARRVLRSFGEMHRATPFDVVHAFFGWPGLHAAMLGARYRVPVVVHPSGGEFVRMTDIGYGMRCSFRGRIGLRAALAGARRVTVSSEPMQRLAAAHGICAERIPLGVALDRWPIAAPRLRDATQPLRLLHVGDLRPVKDQETLIRGASHLHDAGISFELDIVGLDTMNGALQHSAEHLGDMVRWHGVLRREPLRALMDQADILVVSSRHEAGPLVVLEAAIAGVPTVGTAVGHVSEFAPDAAVAVAVRDAAALAREIAALAVDEPRRLSLAREAQRRAVAIDADFTASAFEAIYDELRTGHRP